MPIRTSQVILLGSLCLQCGIKKWGVSLGWSQGALGGTQSVCARPRGIPSRSLRLPGPDLLHFRVNMQNWRTAQVPSVEVYGGSLTIYFRGNLLCLSSQPRESAGPVETVLCLKTLFSDMTGKFTVNFHQLVPVPSH